MAQFSPRCATVCHGGFRSMPLARILTLLCLVAAALPRPAHAQGISPRGFTVYWSIWGWSETVPSTLGPTAEDYDCIDDWKDHIRAHRAQRLAGKTPSEQEVVFRDTWLEITRDFWSRTLAECKRVRPHAKWGFYGMPLAPYFPW